MRATCACGAGSPCGRRAAATPRSLMAPTPKGASRRWMTRPDESQASIPRSPRWRWGAGTTSRLTSLWTTIEGINQRGDCSDFYLVGLLGALHRYRERSILSRSAQSSRWKACVLNFKILERRAGRRCDVLLVREPQILFHACEILAGQLYPDASSPTLGRPGSGIAKRASAWP